MGRPSKMCPAFLDVLVHCHCIPTPLPESGINRQAVEMFLEDEIIRSHPDVKGAYCTTKKGAAWLEAIMAVPYPRLVGAWVDDQDKVLKLEEYP